MNRLAFLALGLLAAALAAVIALEVDASGPPADASGMVAIRHPPPAKARTASEDPVDHTDEWVEGALARPLFSRDRRPTPAVASSSGAAPVLTMPRLTGVLVGPFGKNAIFAPATDGGKPQVLAEGGSIGPFTIQAIAPGRVTVAGPDGTRDLQPSYDAALRTALAVERPVPPPPQPPNAPPGLLPQNQRANLLNFRPGSQFQRQMAIMPNAQPPVQGSQ